jgi:hypothetical protein
MGMAKADVLDRVDADLARGYTAPAIQRLSSLVAAHPTDLDLRRRLASVHHGVGNLIEAGRWGYLHAEADPRATGAFERAYPSTAHRLQKLNWPAHGQAATEFARSRLAGLAELPAPEDSPQLADPAQLPPQDRWHPVGVVRRPGIRLRWQLVPLVLATPFAALGAVTVGQWLVG